MNKTKDLNINNNNPKPKPIITLRNYRRSHYLTRSSWLSHRASNITNRANKYQCLIWSRDRLCHRNNNIINIIVYSHKGCSCRIRATTYRISITKMGITILITKYKRWRFSNKITIIKMVVMMSKILWWCSWIRWKRRMKSMGGEVSITITIITSRITITLIANPPSALRACQQLQVSNQHHQYQLQITIIVSWMSFAQSLPSLHQKQTSLSSRLVSLPSWGRRNEWLLIIYVLMDCLDLFCFMFCYIVWLFACLLIFAKLNHWNNNNTNVM